MIRLLSDKTIGAIRYGKGSLVNLAPEVEVTLIAEGAAANYRVISKSVEVLSSFAVATPCVLTAVDEVLASFTIPASTLGPNSILQIEPLWTFASSPNNKILKVKMGGTSIYAATRTNSVKEAPLIVLANRNSLVSQIQPYDNNYVTAGGGLPNIYTIDFSINIAVQIIGQRAASEALTLEYYRVLHFFGD